MNSMIFRQVNETILYLTFVDNLFFTVEGYIRYSQCN